MKFENFRTYNSKMEGGEKLEKQVKFSLESVKEISLEEYPSDEFSVVELDFLGSNPNSHQLEISDEVLKNCAGSIRGKWIVADMTGVVDCGMHSSKEQIVGQILKDQEVRFEEKDDYLRAVATGIVSKIYAKSFCKLFEDGSNRSVSVEMRCLSNEENENVVDSFNIVGVTVLGKMIRPSSAGSTIDFVRFSEEEADKYINMLNKDKLSKLKEFAKERKQSMAEKTYKVDKSKDAMSTKPWGDVDKNSMRDKIMEATNKASLVKDVYALVQSGWEESPSEHLKYPIMELQGDTFVYNKNALSSALGYAKAEEETAVVTKIEKIYKKLGLDESDGKEEKKMAKEVEFAAVNIGDMWGKLYEALHAKYPEGDCGSVYRIDGIYEEDNKKFAIIKLRGEDTLYRLDFSLTEEGMTLSDEIIKVEVEIVETEEIRKFAEPENADKFKKFEDKPDEEGKEDEDEVDDEQEKDDEDDDDVKMSEDEMKAEMARLQSEIESRDNIIMEKDAEIETLKAFKQTVEDKEKAFTVESVMSSIAKFVDKETADNYRQEGMNCQFAEIDAWSNKVKASIVDKVVKTNPTNQSFTRMSAPIDVTKKTGSVWERL